MTMETWCCKVSFQTIQKIIRLKIRSYRRYGRNGGGYLFLFMRLHAAEPVLWRWKLSTRWSKTAHVTIDLRSWRRINPRPTGFVPGKAGECRWRHRGYQVDPWSRRREVARGVLRSSPKPEKRSIFYHRRGIENFCRLFSTHPWTNAFVSDAWPAPATYHRPCCRPCCQHCDQRVGRSP